MMPEQKKSTRPQSLLSMQKARRAQRDKLRSLIPPHTLGKRVEQESEKSFLEVHTLSEAQSGLSQRNEELRKWTKSQPTIVPKKVLSSATEAKNRAFTEPETKKKQGRKKAA
jgi:hypothetical protein